VGGDSGGRLRAFRSLAGNRALVRVLAGYALFVLTEYSAWLGRPSFLTTLLPARHALSLR
jgi:hypothetical protein